jgi:hypothetical protein
MNSFGKDNVSDLSSSEGEANSFVKDTEFFQANTSLKIKKDKCSKRCKVLK